MSLFAERQQIVDTDLEVSSPSSTGRAADYQARKEAQRCTYPKCDEPPAEDTQLCTDHLADKRRRNKRHMKATRKQLRHTGKCTRCRKRSGTYLCDACKIALGVFVFPTSNVDNSVDNSASKIPSQWRLEPGTTHYRYLGQAKRGPQSKALLDGQDLDFAVEEMQTARLALAYAQSDEVKAMPKAQRDDIMAAALAHVDRAERWLDEVRERHKPRGSR